MLLWLKNMSLKQYVVVSLCLKHLVLNTLILCYYVFKSMALKQYVTMALCLKNLLLCLNNMSLKQYVVVAFCLTHYALEPWTLYFESPLSLSTIATCQ